MKAYSNSNILDTISRINNYTKKHFFNSLIFCFLLTIGLAVKSDISAVVMMLSIFAFSVIYFLIIPLKQAQKNLNKVIVYFEFNINEDIVVETSGCSFLGDIFTSIPIRAAIKKGQFTISQIPNQSLDFLGEEIKGYKIQTSDTTFFYIPSFFDDNEIVSQQLGVD